MSIAVTAKPSRASGMDWNPQPAPRSTARPEREARSRGLEELRVARERGIEAAVHPRIDVGQYLIVMLLDVGHDVSCVAVDAHEYSVGRHAHHGAAGAIRTRVAQLQVRGRRRVGDERAAAPHPARDELAGRPLTSPASTARLSAPVTSQRMRRARFNTGSVSVIASRPRCGPVTPRALVLAPSERRPGTAMRCGRPRRAPNARCRARRRTRRRPSSAA